MAKYRKKPVVIDAWNRWNSEQEHELSEAVSAGKITFTEEGICLIQTLEGTMQANPGDWIIRGIKGEFYPCKPEIFAATYEAV